MCLSVIFEKFMEKFLQDHLNLKNVTLGRHRGGGCLNEGQSYQTENGLLYVKYNKKPGSDIMFNGEYESLTAIEATNTIRVPSPVKSFSDTPLGYVLVMEFLELKSLHGASEKLGTKLAELHKHNMENKIIQKFGFHVTTCCGELPLNNEWQDDWVQFYAKNRLQAQVDMLIGKRNSSSVGDLKTLHDLLLRKIGSFFVDIEVQPSLLHGDMWSGNVGQVCSEPVIFDAGSFYGHSEFDFGIASMFGGFSQKFYDAYFKVLPKQKGFDERNSLYELFHHLNHWNHFGSGYKSGAISILKSLTK